MLLYISFCAILQPDIFLQHYPINLIYLRVYTIPKMNTKPLFSKLKEKLSNQFVRNIGWLGGSELTIRLFRLGATAILARCLNPADYG